MFLVVLMHPGSPGLRTVKQLCVCVCVCVVSWIHRLAILNCAKTIAAHTAELSSLIMQFAAC